MAKKPLKLNKIIETHFEDIENTIKFKLPSQGEPYIRDKEENEDWVENQHIKNKQIEGKEPKNQDTCCINLMGAVISQAISDSKIELTPKQMAFLRSRLKNKTRKEKWKFMRVWQRYLTWAKIDALNFIDSERIEAFCSTFGIDIDKDLILEKLG